MKELLAKFENKAPEIVFEWNDPHTEAQGWVVINSLRGGAAGGGTRMRKGLNKHEVLSLAKTMEVKFTVSGPAIGGAKSGINFDPDDPRKGEVLQRWFKAVVPLLKNYYGTGGDLNVDEIHEVIPYTEELGLWHPQEGVLTGHFSPRENEKIQKIGQLRTGVSKILEDLHFTPDLSRKYKVADMITGYGVSESVRHYYNLIGGSVSGKRVIVQGFGNVGAAAAYYITQAGAVVVGIVDHKGGMLKTEGMDFHEISALFLEKRNNALHHEGLMPFAEANEKIWDMEAEIFLPCAASRLVTQVQIDKLIANGLEVVGCGANVPFADQEIFFGPIAESTDQRISLIPDFISNCGMARVFAYLMQDHAEVSDNAIFTDTSITIRKALEKAFQNDHSKINLTKRSFEIALNQLV
jgi:glutamate dehydrogenase/leucine dehydrogenase